MLLKNLTLFRFPTTLDLSDIEPSLATRPLHPVGALELSAYGFIPPLGHGTQALSHRREDAIWLRLGAEHKILPAAVINDLLQKKLTEIEHAEGRRPGGQARKRMREELIHDLLPRAFVQPSQTDILLDLRHGICALDTPSRKTADTVVSAIRTALGSFPALPLAAEIAPRAVLTGWISGESLPSGLQLGDECELKDTDERGALVRCQRQELQSDEIARHLQSGKQVTRLALTVDDHVSFVLGEDLVLRKFKLLDGALDQLEGTENDDIRAELDARFALMSGEFRRLFALLEPAFKLSCAG